MREFEYFLFENFDADKEAHNPDNPRSFLGRGTDGILSQVADGYTVAGDTALIEMLVKGGVLRNDMGKMAFNCPIFLKEDVVVLHSVIRKKAADLADLLENKAAEMNRCCAEIINGFNSERNLYHILCGMVFDGYFFEYLRSRGVLATSRLHPSGLDYLTVIYEKCEELRTFSDGLLCSYNRLVTEQGSLQSFGDAQGDRFDFYRFFRLMDRGNLPQKFKEAETLLSEVFDKPDKNALLSETVSLVQTGSCNPAVLRLLEMFGYVDRGLISVPVYKPEHQKCILEIERIVEDCLGEAVARMLLDIASSIDLCAVRHGVNYLEIANELYHIVFGSINEELVSRGIVEMPQRIADEGRYFKCIEIY